MKNIEHTPGPSGHNFIAYDERYNEYRVSAKSYEEAKVLQAAPSLLEALVAIHNILGWLSAESFYEIPDKVIDQMTAAIASAKGEQP